MLKYGAPVILRPRRSDDGERIRDAFDELMPDTVFTHLFMHKRELDDDDVRRVTGMDFQERAALLAVLGSGDTETIIGGASYVASSANPAVRKAEIAILITEKFQGRGFAPFLLRRLAKMARASGFVSLHAEVLMQNTGMLALFWRSGLPMTTRATGGVVQVTLCLNLEAEAVRDGRLIARREV